MNNLKKILKDLSIIVEKKNLKETDKTSELKYFDSVSFNPPKNRSIINPNVARSTELAALNRSEGKTKLKSNMSLFTIIRIKEPMVKKIPRIPEIPKPGITKISKLIKIMPKRKTNISQFSASPFR